MRAEGHAPRTIVALLVLAIGLLGALEGRAADDCADTPSGFQLLDPGDDESGVGGTGISAPVPLATPTARATSAGDDSDSGIGGTGRAPRPVDDDDSGIGGTGVFGTVTRSDRLCVNGFAIEVPESLAIESAGGGPTDRSLAVGQVVFVEAARREGELEARRIVLLEAHAGQIEVLGGERQGLVLSGRRVRIAGDAAWGEGLEPGALWAGQWISIDGLVDAQGTLVATRLAPGLVGRVSHPEEDLADRLPGWLGDAGPLAYVSIEGFVEGSAERPVLGGIAIAFDRTLLGTTLQGLRLEGLRPGAHVRLGGQIDAAQTLQLAPPPRPPRSRAAPEREGARDGTIRRAPSAPPEPSETTRPKRPAPSRLPPRPDTIRPDIRRHTKRPPARDVRPAR